MGKLLSVPSLFSVYPVAPSSSMLNVRGPTPIGASASTESPA
jgi:hypothetical protein